MVEDSKRRFWVSLALTVPILLLSPLIQRWLGLEGEIFFWELATLIDLMLVGQWIEVRSVMGASMALEKLVEIMPSEGTSWPRTATPGTCPSPSSSSASGPALVDCGRHS